MATTGPALWPGANTFPNANVYPGQGNLPLYRCYIYPGPVVKGGPVSISPDAWVDVSDDLRAFSIQRGRNSEFQAVDAGTATVTLDARDKSVFSYLPMYGLWLLAEFDGFRVSRFKGYVNEWSDNWPEQSGKFDQTITASASDEFSVISLATLPTSGNIPSVKGDAQAIFILDQIDNQAPRSFQAFDGLNGTAASARAMTGQGASDELANCIAVEQNDSVIFVAADGTITGLKGTYRSSAPFNVVQAHFDDAGSNLPYQALDGPGISNSFIFNQITVTFNDGTATASDSTSVAQYGPRSFNAIVPSNGVAGSGAALASSLLAKYKDGFTRIQSIAPKMADAATCSAVLQLELMEKVQVDRQEMLGPTITVASWIQNISESGQPGVPPSITLGISSL